MLNHKEQISNSQSWTDPQVSVASASPASGFAKLGLAGPLSENSLPLQTDLTAQKSIFPCRLHPPCQVSHPRAPVSSGGTTQTPILTQASCFFNRWWLPHFFSSGPGLTIPSGHQRVLEPRLLLRQTGWGPPGVRLGPDSEAWLPAGPADSPGYRQTRPSAWPLGGSG